MQEDDYLIHYGVLGMKWGMHRAAKKGTTYNYKSSQTKGYEKRASKYSEKAKKFSANKEKSQKFKNKAQQASKLAKQGARADKQLQNYAKKTSVGKAIAQNIVFGSYGGSKSYARLRASGVSRGKAAGKQLLASYGSAFAGSLLGVAGATGAGVAGQQMYNNRAYQPKKTKKKK